MNNISHVLHRFIPFSPPRSAPPPRSGFFDAGFAGPSDLCDFPIILPVTSRAMPALHLATGINMGIWLRPRGLAGVRTGTERMSTRRLPTCRPQARGRVSRHSINLPCRTFIGLKVRKDSTLTLKHVLRLNRLFGINGQLDCGHLPQSRLSPPSDCLLKAPKEAERCKWLHWTHVDTTAARVQDARSIPGIRV